MSFSATTENLNAVMGAAAIDILMITFNRAEYTRLSLGRLLDTCDERMRVWVWHNGGDSSTLDAVSSYRTHPRLHHIHVSPTNARLREPTNWFWKQSDAPFVAKVDDDCLMPAGWAKSLLSAHRTPDVGILACWHFRHEDFLPDLASRKTRVLTEDTSLLLNCWVQGSGYIMKRSVYQVLGPLKHNQSFTNYGIAAASLGWINGWHLPLIQMDHMDDPRSTYSRFQTEEDFQRGRPLSAIQHGIHSLEEWKRRLQWSARRIQEAPYRPELYIGWRAGLRRALERGKRYARMPQPWEAR